MGLGVICFVIAESVFVPWKFRENTHVDLVLKVALLILMIFATSFVDMSAITSDSSKATRQIYGWICIAVLSLGTVFALFRIAFWAYDTVTSVGATAANTLFRF